MYTFTRDREKGEVASLLSQIINKTTQRSPLTSEDCREKRRYVRAIPVLLGPWESDKAEIERFTVGITNDMSEGGVAVSIPHSWTIVHVLCGFWCDSATFMRGVVRRKAHIGGNFWQLGIELKQVIRPASISNLDDLNDIVRALDNRPVVRMP